MRILSNFWNFFRIIRLFILQIVALSTRRLFLKPSLLTAPTLASEQMLSLLALPDPRFSFSPEGIFVMSRVEVCRVCQYHTLCKPLARSGRPRPHNFVRAQKKFLLKSYNDGLHAGYFYLNNMHQCS
mgnify:CR=1 FL=1